MVKDLFSLPTQFTYWLVQVSEGCLESGLASVHAENGVLEGAAETAKHVYKENFS